MPKKSTPKKCACGCGQMTKGGEFCMGHDSKMKSRLLKEADTGNEKAIATLLERGWATPEYIEDRIAKAGIKADRAAEREARREEKAEKKAEPKVATKGKGKGKGKSKKSRRSRVKTREQ